MKKLIISLFLLTTIKVMANQKKVSCSVLINGMTVETINETFNESKNFIEFKSINDLHLSVGSHPHSEIIAMRIYDTEAFVSYFGYGSFGEIDENVTLGISHKNDKIELICKKLI